MDRVEGNGSGAGKGRLRRLMKKGTAWLLALYLAVSPAVPGFTVKAMADGSSTELPDEGPDENGEGGLGNGACEGTAYGWVRKASTWEKKWNYKIVGESNEVLNKTGRFDLHGLLKGQTEYKDADEEDDEVGSEENGIRTTFHNLGFATLIQTEEDFDKWDNISNWRTYSSSEKTLTMTHVADGRGNGSVEKLDSLGLELKIALSPSPDNKYVFVDYYVYNTDTVEKGVRLGTGCDDKIGGGTATLEEDDDLATLYLNDRGFHMVNRKTKTTFDCITNDEELGVTKPDKRWIGDVGIKNSSMPWTSKIFSDTDKDKTDEDDSAMTYSWQFQLRPYETVHKRVAFAAKATSYYVSNNGRNSDDDSESGTYSKPFQTIDYALNKLGSRKGYIYIMDDQEISSPITISGDITIASTDFDAEGHTTNGKAGYIKTLKRSGSNTIFKVDGDADAALNLTDITLDGNGVESDSPLLSASSGTLEINSGTKVTGCLGKEGSLGSAVTVTGDASLSMNSCEVSGNVSEDKGAVYFDGSGFDIANKVLVEGNATASGGKSNVYLGDGKYITVDSDLKDSKIGVTTSRQPDASSEGESTSAGQEVKVAAPKSGSAVDISPCIFTDSFFADNPQDGFRITSGTVGLPDTVANDRNAVLKRDGCQITFAYTNADTGAVIMDEGASRPPVSYASGESVEIAPPQALTGYKFIGVKLDGESSGSLSWDDVEGADYGKVTGTMPGQDVVVEYQYQAERGSIRFEANGGTPQPDKMEGKVDSPVNGTLPSVSRYGYLFKGWSEAPEQPNMIITSLPDTYPAGEITYYAIFEPDPNITFKSTSIYSNESGSIQFKASEDSQRYSVEAPFSAQAQEIHGYTWSPDNSGTAPERYNYSGGEGGEEAIGSFDASSRSFSGKMPGQDTAISFRYKVDYDSGDSAKSTLTVRHESEGGRVIDESAIECFPEKTITVQPLSPYGYECMDSKVTAGAEPDKTDGHLASALQGDFDSNHAFHGEMPNQDVTIVYTYKATGEGYPLTIKYTDNDTNDEALQNIKEPYVKAYQADDPVSVAYREPYGYQLDTQTISPPGSSLGLQGHDLAGTMPSDSVDVAYTHNRNSAFWKKITYRAGEHGSLSKAEGTSPDVSETDGEFSADALYDDGTGQGAQYGYTLKDMEKKHLIPEASADNYYRFTGWFIDSNDNKRKDADEDFVSPDSRFTGDTVLTAAFEEDPAKWVDIRFEAGSHGSIAGASSLHTTYDKTWGDIAAGLPQATPEINYLRDGWNAGDRPMEDGMALADGQTYTARFIPDPDAFGTDVATPEALAGLNSKGKGKVTAYNTSAGYQYLLADPSGTILQVLEGNELPGRVTFDGLYPGAEYKAYEAAGGVRVKKGDKADALTGAVSDPAKVTTPVLETNYQVLYDEQDEGKTSLLIKPADPASEYAVLDPDGHVIGTEDGRGGFKKAAGSPASLEFDGLGYNLVYTVVARPLGADDAAESLIDRGSVVTTDPGGELKLPTYIIETVNGRIDQVGDAAVGTSRYEAAHKGDAVKISADEANGAGEPFSHWEATIGTAGGQGSRIASREASFIMEDANVVLTAVYKRQPASPSNATVVDEVRGGSRKETSLDPNEIPRLEEELTTEADRVMMDVNHSDVTYKAVYRKTAVKASDSNAVKASGLYDMEHEPAYKGAWGLDVTIERYVNGRRVPGAAQADAEFRTYIQLGRDDVDMLDYQLYEITSNPATGEAEAAPVSWERNPEETGGLFAFTAHAGSRYVMVYNRAYRVYFINTAALPVENRYLYCFKVRRDEAPADPIYRAEYGQVEEQLDYFVDPNGVEYHYEGWSASQSRFKEFDPLAQVRRRTYVYAYYQNNEKEVEEARNELEDAIEEAIRICGDYFMKQDESADLRGSVEEALAILDRDAPMATAGELKEALERLVERTKHYKEVLDERYKDYDDSQENGDKGGSRGGGGGGGGTAGRPYNASSPKSYTAGTNGSWVVLSTGEGGERQLAFVLNGGMRLSSMWALIRSQAGASEQAAGWYRFNDKGIMESGWIQDESGKWYYCSTEKEGSEGMMQAGWHLDGADAGWYYLDPESGEMAVGWRQIGEKWYFFEPAGAGAYAYDPQKEAWSFTGSAGHPLGSMYKNEMTPDGFMTDADGAWIQ